METKNVIEYRDFGYIAVKLDALMTKKRITTYELCNRTNIRFQTIKNLRENPEITRVEFAVLSKICYVLDCKLTDIIDYIPPKEK